MTISRSSKPLTISGAGIHVSTFSCNALACRNCKVIIQNVTCRLCTATLDTCTLILDNAHLVLDDDDTSIVLKNSTVQARYARVNSIVTRMELGTTCDMMFVEWIGAIHVHESVCIRAQFTAFTARPGKEAFCIFNTDKTLRTCMLLVHCSINCEGSVLIEMKPGAQLELSLSALVAVCDKLLVPETGDCDAVVRGLTQYSGDVVFGDSTRLSVVDHTFSVCRSHVTVGSHVPFLTCRLP